MLSHWPRYANVLCVTMRRCGYKIVELLNSNKILQKVYRPWNGKGKLTFLSWHARYQRKWSPVYFHLQKTHFYRFWIFLSYSQQKYKTNSISTVINRSYSICSSWTLFDVDMKFLANYFETNGYPGNIFRNALAGKFRRFPSKWSISITICWMLKLLHS